MGRGITIVGLGPGGPEGMTIEGRRVVDEAPRLLLRTTDHPAAQDIAARRAAESFDAAYDAGPSFEEVYRAIVQGVLDAGRLETGVVYVVPGDPMVGEATTLALLDAARAEGLPIRIVHAPSFLEACLEAAGLDALDGLQVADGVELARSHFPRLSPDRPALVGQVYSRLVASEVKLTLLAQYPPQHKALVIDSAGSDRARVEWMPLEELDRGEWFGTRTSVFVPPLAAPSAFETFQATIAHLRAPDGCPWDREQTSESLRPHLLEEAYETLEAIDSGSASSLREELGDLLLQIVLQAQIASESGDFTMADVISGIQDKIVRRHPHVFGGLEVKDVDQVLHHWEHLKEGERELAGGGKGALDGVPRALPALAQALEIQSRARRVGLDWPAMPGARAKIDEELAEVDSAADGPSREAEIGDLLFAVVNYARWLGVDPETALRGSNARFRRRFARMEAEARASGRSLRDLRPDAIDALWEAAKDAEDAGPA